MPVAVTVARLSSVKMDPQARDPWRTKYKASACAAGINSQSMCAIAVGKSTVRRRRAGRPARRLGSAVGWASLRTAITSVAQCTWSGYARGGPATRGIGAPIGVMRALRYKTPLCLKSLNLMEKAKTLASLRYKTR